MNNDLKERDICCPPFNPEPWDEKTTEWNSKRFIRDHVFTLFYIPLNFGAVMKRFDRKVRAAGGEMAEGLCLADHTSKWNMDLYLAVDREIPGAGNTTLSGRFFSKVFEGPFKDTPKWHAQFSALTRNRGMKIRKHFMWYTTCPKCAKKYGKNYVVIVGETE